MKKSYVFWGVYVLFVAVLAVVSVLFLQYVWSSIQEYETARPEYLLERTLDELEEGMGLEKIVFPAVEENAFSDETVVKDAYYDILKTASLSYRFARDDYHTGERIYHIYAQEEPIGKLVLETVSEEKRLGFLNIAQMQVARIEPVLDVMMWNYHFRVLDHHKILVNGVEVTKDYQVGEKQDISEYQYLYEYVDMPRCVEYQLDGLYQEGDIQILDEDGMEIAYEMNGNSIDTTAVRKKSDEMPEEVTKEIDVLQAAKTWSLFMSRDLAGASYGLNQVRRYFIEDSYYWNKLGEYARGVDITFVSEHSLVGNGFSEERVSEYQSYGDDAFSCRIQFHKNMRLGSWREQVDVTDSVFYFVKATDAQGNIGWKIADIQAVVNE